MKNRKLSYKHRISAVILGIILWGCLSATSEGITMASAASATEFTFDQYEMVTGSALRQTVLTGFLLNGAVADLAVVHIDERNLHRLRIYTFDGRTWVPRLDTTLGPDMLFVDVVKIGGRDRLITYEVHYGKPRPNGGTTFTSEVGVTFQSDHRIQLEMDRQDFDGDGQVDLMLTTIEVRFLGSSLWKSLKGLMGDDVWLELEFYCNEGGRFSDKPNAIRRIALDGAPSHREPGSVSLDIVLRGATHEKRKTQKRWLRAFNMLLRVGDVTGDGRSDLFIGKNTPNGLDAFVGVPGPDLFTRQAQDVPVVVPNDEEYAWLVDLNRDGKQDILMHHPFTLRDVHGARIRPPGTEPHRVTVLIAR
jgi:hypothetical protein